MVRGEAQLWCKAEGVNLSTVQTNVSAIGLKTSGFRKQKRDAWEASQRNEAQASNQGAELRNEGEEERVNGTRFDKKRRWPLLHPNVAGVEPADAAGGRGAGVGRRNGSVSVGRKMESVCPKAPQPKKTAQKTSPLPGLSINQQCQRLLLADVRCSGEVSTSNARVWLKNKLGAKGVSDVAGELRTALKSLEEEGVVSVKLEDAEARPRGRRVMTFEKKTWPQVEKNPRAKAYVSSLGLGDAHFEN